ncbi:malto-oligosyltrehalose trehalohydrolase [Mycolicibacterium brisbanense]|uniref:Malto-oligosyltrehalose trehalohydrolase n=2 Tax=Mycolicibacterium brisbanense TaxID=146020 RepID=A0A100W6R0_9MYCO|nr:malto-oligosyltrehalose trehalohydrolase [Mycolicibacterium brisbanense]
MKSPFHAPRRIRNRITFKMKPLDPSNPHVVGRHSSGMEIDPGCHKARHAAPEGRPGFTLDMVAIDEPIDLWPVSC